MINKILIYQAFVMIIVALVNFALGGWHKALSSMIGGGVALVPNIFFALRIYKSIGQPPKKIVRSFYAGESGKLLLTGLLFYIIFQIPNIEILPLLSGYVAVLSVFWFALIMR
ncbi:MAG: ATP synthase subunit I [Methylococcaceae bacterium]